VSKPLAFAGRLRPRRLNARACMARLTQQQEVQPEHEHLCIVRGTDELAVRESCT
jgi:hypothetical protein